MSEPVDRRRIARALAWILSLWALLAVFNSSEFYRRGLAGGNAVQTWPDVLCFQLSSSLVWALFTPLIIFLAERFPIRRPNRSRNAAILLPLVPVLALIRAVSGAAIGKWGEGDAATLEFAVLSIRIRFFRYAFVILVIIGITNLLLAYRSGAARERSALAVKAAVADAEIQRLRATIQPRYLFSTIDAIAANIRAHPAVADRMLVDLCDLLRATQEHAALRVATLGEELELVDRYLDLERTRTEGRFVTRVVIDEELLTARVPPLILRSLVEAVCVGSRGHDTGTCEIRGRRQGDELVVEMRHDGDGDPVRSTRIVLPLDLPREAKAS